MKQFEQEKWELFHPSPEQNEVKNTLEQVLEWGNHLDIQQVT